MTIRARVLWWYAGILLVSLGLMAAVLKREWDEQYQRSREGFTEDDPVWEEVSEVMLYYGVPTALLVLVVGGWLLRKALMPIGALTEAAERIDLDNLGSRLPSPGTGDELDRLTDVFNRMMQRLEDSFRHVREFTLDASHELKTPLTIMRAELESTAREGSWTTPQRELFARQIDEIERLTRIVDGLTLLAKADAGQLPLKRESLRLDDLVRESVTDAEVLARPSGVGVRLRTCEPVALQADRHRLRQLLLNLTENAIKYNCKDGSVIVDLRRRNGMAELRISNTGPGIPPEKLPRVFDRFFRCDPAHNSEVEGCGLGLSIAQWIARAHGGDIKVDSKVGRETAVTVQLPGGS
jgi:signal transduction histidine kinase